MLIFIWPVDNIHTSEANETDDANHQPETMTMRNEISLTDDQIEDLFQEAFSTGVSIDSVTFTRDTIANFIDGLQGFESWNKPTQDTCEGFATLEVMQIKVGKGRPKQDLQVIDLGTVRAVCQSNS